MSQDLDTQAGAARIDPMRQPLYRPGNQEPPRATLMSRILAALERQPLSLQGLIQTLGESSSRISPILSDAKARGLVIPEGGPPAIYRRTRPGETPPPRPKARTVSTGVRGQVRQILAAEGALTVAVLLERLPGVTRQTLIDNLRKWETDGGCVRVATLEPGGPLICLPDQETSCPSPPAPVAIASTSSPTPTPPTSPAGSPRPEARAVAVRAAPPASAPPPTEASATSRPTCTPAPEPRSPTAADLPSLEEAQRDPVLLGTLKAYWGLQQALDHYVDGLLAQDPVYVALASAVDAAKAAVQGCRRALP